MALASGHGVVRGRFGRVRWALIVATASALTAMASPAWADTCTWNKATSGSWINTANWNNCSGSYPQSDDSVVLDSTGVGAVDIDTPGTATVVNLTMTNAYTGDIHSQNDRALVVTGNLSIGGGRMGARSDSTDTIGGLTVNGNTTLWGVGILHAPTTMTLGNAASDELIIQDNGDILGTTSGRTINGAIWFRPDSSTTQYFGTNTKASLTIEDPEEAGLVGYWKLDEPSGTTAYDNAGGADLTAVNNSAAATTTSGTSVKLKNTHERTFDGTDDGMCVASPAVLEPGQTWTIAAWVNAPTNIPDSFGTIIHGGNNYALRIQGGNNATKTVTVMMWNTADDYIIHTTAATFPANTWTHLAAVNDGNKLIAYINGTAYAGSNYAGEQDWDKTDQFCIGQHDTNTGFDFSGRIDDVRVYDDVLTVGQIGQLAAGRPAGTGGTHTYTLAEAITTTGDFIIDNGTVAAGSNTITVGGNWTNYGTYTGTGLVTMNGTTTGYTIKSNGSSFNALTFNGSGGGWTLSDALDVTGVITLTNGNLAASSYNITAANIAATSGTFTPNTGTVTLDSPSDVTVGAASFNNLTLNSSTSGGTLTTEDPDLLRYFQFEEGSGTNADDSSASDSDGTLVNTPTWISGPSLPTVTYPANTRALSFNTGGVGDNEKVTFSFNTQPAQVTAAAWVYRTAAGEAWPRVVQLSHFRMYLGGTSGDNELGAYSARSSGTNGDWRSESDAVATGGWHHIAVTYDGSNLSNNPKFYVDGVLLTGAFTHDVQPTGAGYDSSTSTGYIADDSGGTGSFVGYMDEVRIFDRILSDAEITTLFEGGTTGTVTPNAGAIFSLGATTTAVSGTLTVTWGTLNVGNGKTLNTTGTVDIDNLITIPAGGIMTATGNVSLTNALTLGGSLTTGAGTVAMPEALTVSSGGTMTTGAGTVTLDKLLTVNGTYAIGGGRTTMNGATADVTVNNGGTLRMNTLSGSLRMYTGRTLTMDGTLETTTGSHANQPVIDTASGLFYFNVGSGASATPTLNLNGLSIYYTDTDGMYINYFDGANTIIKRFDNVKFLGTRTPAGKTALLTVRGSSNKPMSIIGEGVVFDTTYTTYNVKVTDQDGGGKDTRIELSSTCTAAGETTCENYDSDADTGNDNVPDDAGNDGAIALFSGGVVGFHDSAGEVVGFPVISFNWSNFAILSTYIAYNNVTGAGTNSRLYRRTSAGVLAGNYKEISYATYGALIGPPRWVQVGSNHYVFLLTTNGTVFKFQDDGTNFTEIWHYRNHASNATATTPLVAEGSYLYWVGNGSVAATPKFFSLKQTATPVDNQTNIDATGLNGTPGTVASGTAAPTVGLVGTTRSAFFATSGNLYKYTVSSWTGNNVTPSAPTLSSVYGRASYSQFDQKFFLVDDTGRVFGIDSGLATTWSYAPDTGNHGASCPAGGNCMGKELFYNRVQGYVYFGDQDGHVYAVKRNGVMSTGIVVSNFPLNTNTTGYTNVFQTMPHYRSGVITIGAANGRLLFIDQQNASSAPKLIRTYQFSSTITAVSFDSTNSRYLVSCGDGKYYYIPVVSDPTSGNN